MLCLAPQPGMGLLGGCLWLGHPKAAFGLGCLLGWWVVFGTGGE